MKRFARLLIVTFGFGVLGFAMSLVPQKNATGAGAAPVNIVSSVPLSLTGSITASIPGTVNANITNSSLPVSVSFPTALTGSAVPVTLQTHLGVPPANLITLQCQDFSSGSCTSFHKLNTDLSFPAFSLQPGTGLVITDIEIITNGTAGQLGGLAIQQVNCFGVIYAVLAVADQTGFISAADHITGGLHFTTLPCFAAPASTQNLTLIGYLVQE